MEVNELYSISWSAKLELEEFEGLLTFERFLPVVRVIYELTTQAISASFPVECQAFALRNNPDAGLPAGLWNSLRSGYRLRLTPTNSQ